MSGTTTRRLPDRTWHVSRGGARSSAAGDPDERHDCDNDDATPPTIGYGQEAKELPQGGSLRDNVDTSVTLKRTLICQNGRDDHGLVW